MAEKLVNSRPQFSVIRALSDSRRNLFLLSLQNINKFISLESSMPIIRLESSDKEIFDIDQDIIKCSETIRTALEDLGNEADNGVLPVPKVNSLILEKVIAWAAYHKDDPVVEEKDKRIDDISPWDANFLDVDQDTLFDLIMAANYLNIQGLLQLTCKTVANMIMGKTPQEIRETFSLKNDFSPQEEEEAARLNMWYGED